MSEAFIFPWGRHSAGQVSSLASADMLAMSIPGSSSQQQDFRTLGAKVAEPSSSVWLLIQAQQEEHGPFGSGDPNLRDCRWTGEQTPRSTVKTSLAESEKSS